MRVPFSMAIVNVELIHNCFPNHSSMGTARMKYDKDTEKEGKQRRMNMERRQWAQKKMSKHLSYSLGLPSLKPYMNNLTYIYEVLAQLGLFTMQKNTLQRRKRHWRMDRRLGLNRLISAQPLIVSTINEFSISTALWVLEVLCCPYWHSFNQIDHSTIWLMVVGVNWLMLCQEAK